jgi:hypothetical protein
MATIISIRVYLKNVDWGVGGRWWRIKSRVKEESALADLMDVAEWRKKAESRAWDKGEVFEGESG